MKKCLKALAWGRDLAWGMRRTLGAAALALVPFFVSVASAQGIPSLSGYDRETRHSMELACVLTKGDGPVAYGDCLNKQIASLQGASGIPSLSGYDRETRHSMELACVLTKGDGPVAYGDCLNKQIASLQEASAKTSPRPKAVSAQQKQNPNLADKFEVGRITYKDGSTAAVKYQDDLAPRIAALPQAAADPKRWLFVIGAEKYQTTDSILFARRSAEQFTQVIQKKFGVLPGKTIALYDDKASAGAIKSQLRGLLERGVQKGDSLILYYNGHGIPNPQENNQAYILPTDTVPDYVADDPFFSISNLTRLLREDKNLERITIVMDSCFTGQTDGKSVFKGDKAAVALVPKKVQIDDKRMVLITAGGDKEYSSAFQEKGHRMMSYYLISSLLDGYNNAQDVFQSMAPKVRNESTKGGPLKVQNPQMQGNGKLPF